MLLCNQATLVVGMKQSVTLNLMSVLESEAGFEVYSVVMQQVMLLVTLSLSEPLLD